MSVTALDDPYARAADRVSPTAVVVGDGIIGLSIAAELARRGAKVTVLGRAQQGAASWASGGLLAPSTGPLPDAVRAFFMASLGAYPGFVARLRAQDPGLEVISGLIQLLDEDDQTAAGAAAGRVLDADALARLEPELPWRTGMVLHPDDGAVDARRLVAALRRELAASARVVVLHEASARRVDFGDWGARVVTSTGETVAAETAIIAAGAWSGQLGGLPRALPVSPLKGQMIALAGSPLRHATLGGHTYLVPRGDVTIVGSTSEDVGFDWTTDQATVDALAATAGQITPRFRGARVVDRWAGVRPMTPDKLPIIGRDPDVPALIYACGHSRNGILLAPATAEAVAELVMQTIPAQDLGPFAVTRFGSDR